ncbi:MAG: RNA ligase (ATP) [FCB group bacterium]|nr:RNA ligase (ATP) [FCB group bacterium]
MSSLIVEVCQVSDIKQHPNADRLDLITIKGWQVITGRGEYKTGDKVVYIPPDAVLPERLIEELGVEKYLAGKDKNRVRVARLRGEVSMGLVFRSELSLGADVAECFGVTKYEPPIRPQHGDVAPKDANFPEYTNIENINNFPAVFNEGETVVVTEKIDGSNCRVGFEIKPTDARCPDIEMKAGSHRVKRIEPDSEKMVEQNIYWYPHSLKPIRGFLEYKIDSSDATCVTVYGEVYGKVRGGHKSLHYGRLGTLNFIAFDIEIDWKYLSWEDFNTICDTHNIPRPPVLYVGPYSIEKMRELAVGSSELAKINGADHMREGIVIRSYNERSDTRCSRAVLKMLNPEYLLLKEKKRAKGEVVDFADV